MGPKPSKIHDETQTASTSNSNSNSNATVSILSLPSSAALLTQRSTSPSSRSPSPEYHMHVPAAAPPSTTTTARLQLLASPSSVETSAVTAADVVSDQSRTGRTPLTLMIACPAHVSPPTSKASSPVFTSTKKSTAAAPPSSLSLDHKDGMSTVNPLTPPSSPARRRAMGTFASSLHVNTTEDPPTTMPRSPAVSPSTVHVATTPQRLSSHEESGGGSPHVTTTPQLHVVIGTPILTHTPLTPSSSTRRRDSSAIAFLPVAVRLNDNNDTANVGLGEGGGGVSPATRVKAAGQQGAPATWTKEVMGNHTAGGCEEPSSVTVANVANVSFSLSLFALGSSDDFDSPHGDTTNALASAESAAAVVARTSSLASSSTTLSLSGNTHCTVESLTYAGAPHRAQLARRSASERKYTVLPTAAAVAALSTQKIVPLHSWDVTSGNPL